MGLLLHLVFPLHILATTLARGIGVVCILVSFPLAIATLRALSCAHTPWILLLVVPVLLVIRYGVIAREEAYLTRKFGDAYRQYTVQVRRWL